MGEGGSERIGRPGGSYRRLLNHPCRTYRWLSRGQNSRRRSFGLGGGWGDQEEQDV